MSLRIQKEFFLQPSVTVAPALIGKLICRRTAEGVVRRRITETECYYGAADTACHARRGLTPGNRALFSEGGVAYVYLCYGLHYLFNVVTGPKGHGEGVLIRGVQGANGPGLVTRLLAIDKTFYLHDLCASDALWLEDDGTILEYTASPRVGIDYADKDDRERPWRYRAKLKIT